MSELTIVESLELLRDRLLRMGALTTYEKHEFKDRRRIESRLRHYERKKAKAKDDANS
jgi:hypothetical protein